MDVRRELLGLEQRLARPGQDGTKVATNVSNLILTWEWFGPEFGADDRTLLQDYVHFLLVRDSLEEFVTAATPATRSYLEAPIGPSDDAFRAATTPVDSGIIRLFPRASGNWWWRVTPRQLGRELRRQFAGAG